MDIKENSFLYAIFDHKTRPVAAGIRTANNSAIIPLYVHGTSQSIYAIAQSIKKLNKWLEKSLLSNKNIITNDFKSVLSGFKFSLPDEKLNVYDTIHPSLEVPSTLNDINVVVSSGLDALQRNKIQYWQYAAANAAVVYEHLERIGILVGGILKHPKWSYDTTSGRSKTKEFNIQGTNKDDCITDRHGSGSDIFINFDWRGADIRIAAILSDDDHLNDISLGSDPYQKIADIIDQPRNESKIMLLSAINALRVDDPVIGLFPKLQKWMTEQKDRLSSGQPVYSILRRSFYNEKKPLSSFNATMQGSIAHAMQLTIRKIWEAKFRLLAETHDSITIACTKEDAKETVREISNIMCRPFSGILKNNPIFPVRVSVGKHWCQWKQYRLYLDVDKTQ